MNKRAQSSEWIFWITRILFTLVVFITVFVFTVHYVDVQVTTPSVENDLLAQHIAHTIIRDNEILPEFLGEQGTDAVSQIIAPRRIGARAQLITPAKRANIQEWHINKDTYELLSVQSQATFWKKGIAQSTTSIPVKIGNRDATLIIDVLQES